MRRATELSLKVDAGVYGAAGAIFHAKKRWGYPLENIQKTMGNHHFFSGYPRIFGVP